MSDYQFQFQSHQMSARASGVLWWADQKLLCVSDMHLGKSERMARRGGSLLPPYETHETLARLGEEIAELKPKTVVCLGDSFDDLKALDNLNPTDFKRISSLIAGREWVWIEGNHDAGPVSIGGSHVKEHQVSGVTFRHVAETGKSDEISGHYHPKKRVTGPSAACFLVDNNRIIMPAFGTYTGGLRSEDQALDQLMDKSAVAVLTGRKAIAVPMKKP